MGLLLIALLCLVAAAVLYFPFPKIRKTSYNVLWSYTRIWANTFLIIGLLIFALTIFLTVGYYADQVSTNATIRNTYHIQQIKEEKAKDLLPQFKNLLAIQYPQYEKQIFESISSPDDVQAFFVRYPEIKASKTITDYADRINSLQGAVYDQREIRANEIKSAEVNKESPFTLTSFLPDPAK